MSRSSVVWGPFSIVWGLAMALVTLLLYKYKGPLRPLSSFAGTFLGGAYEYLQRLYRGGVRHRLLGLQRHPL